MDENHGYVFDLFYLTWILFYVVKNFKLKFAKL